VKNFILPCLFAVAASLAYGQQGADIVGRIVGGQKAVIAIPDFRGAGRAGNFAATFNETLFSDIDQAGVFKMAPKSMFPLNVPQRPEDFRKPLQYDPNNRTRAPWLLDWSEPPVSSDFLAFGYTAEQDNQMVLFGWLFNVRQPEVSGAQVIGKIYHGSLDEEGARKVAHEFATDILRQFGVESLAGSKIYFVSNRSGSKEIWVMDYDGSNQKQFTFYKNLVTMPNVSPDGTRLAFTSFAGGAPQIVVHSLETGRKIPFYNQRASMNATAAFTPDGKQIIYSSTASGWAQLYRANSDGSKLERLTNTRSIEVEPKINPKTGNEILFVSGRGGPQQIYKMNIDGTDVTRLTTGEGEASNPSWNPQGSHMAFAWTRGYSPGNWNIFIMDVATREYVQLTQGAGRNENPTWAPDGRHVVFSSNRSGSMQIWSMLADGTQLRQLTSAGVNEKPVWTK
jgi:TolB protein